VPATTRCRADGADTLAGDAGADSFSGGNGLDIADYNSAVPGLRASLLAPATNSGTARGDTYVSKITLFTV